MEEFESFSRDWLYWSFFVLENTNSVTWLVHCPGKNILNIKQREGGDPGLDWDQGRGLNSSGHTRLSLSEDNAGRGSRAPWHAVWLLPRHLPPKNKEQKKKDTDELIKLRRQLVQPNCPNKLGPFMVNSLNEFRRVIWLHLHKWVSAHSVHVTRWSPITPQSVSM